MEIIKLNNIKKEFGLNEAKVQALKGVNLIVNEGDMIAIMGPSGAGKSTLLNILGFLDKPTSGKYEFEGKDVGEINNNELAKYRNKNIGFVVQNFALIDDYTVYENIEIPLNYAKITKKDKKYRIENLLRKMNIFEKKDRLPSEISGGQNQRVAIARALVNNPKVILADEPTGALDRKTGSEVMDLFIQLNKSGKTIIIITHDEEVANKCKRKIYIEDGLGKEINI